MTEASPLESIYSDTLDCVHCGLCLTSCPTYRESGRETSSPRGRVSLMRGVAEGKIDLSSTLTKEAFLCLGCRACETACPSGVKYGKMLEHTRMEIEMRGYRKGLAAWVERFALRYVIASRRVLRTLVSVLRFIQIFRIDDICAFILPKKLASAQTLAPTVPAKALRKRLPFLNPAYGKKRGRVAFFEGCIMPEIFGSINRATVEVLRYNGFDVVIPSQQVCCGALHAHSGNTEMAHNLAKRNIDSFDYSSVDAIISNSAGCGAAMKEYSLWLGEQGSLFSSATRDILEFLDEVGLRKPDQRISAKVCYDDPCHLVHAQRVFEAPSRVLESIPGLELVLHKDATRCCGAAGIYNLTQPEMSHKVLKEKLNSLRKAKPDIVLTGNPGCLMQLRTGIAGSSFHAEVLHPVELLCKAYEPSV